MISKYIHDYWSQHRFVRAESLECRVSCWFMVFELLLRAQTQMIQCHNTIYDLRLFHVRYFRVTAFQGCQATHEFRQRDYQYSHVLSRSKLLKMCVTILYF